MAERAPCRPGARPGVGEIAGHERPRAAPRDEVPLREEIAQREDRRCARDAQIPGEDARRRQPRPWSEHPVDDRPTHCLVDLRLQGRAPAQIERDQEHEDGLPRGEAQRYGAAADPAGEERTVCAVAGIEGREWAGTRRNTGAREAVSPSRTAPA